MLKRLRTAEDGPLLFIREALISAFAVLAVGLFLFAVSGVWPPMVAVESGSMEPHMHKGDLVFITGPERYAPDAAVEGTSVVTAEVGADVGYRTFGGDGSVIVYDNPGVGGPPIIHRSMLWVEEGENWYDRANPDHMSASNCQQLTHCPAPYDGFITKGDNNARYDQVSGISEPVRPEWVQGVARIRIPFLGWVRLTLASTMSTATPVTPVTVEQVPASVVQAPVPVEQALSASMANDPVHVAQSSLAA
ncbi:MULTISPECIES: S26 family signal peptidase [Haloferax]|uniref:S26 family signal peptidase n=1 Tax=Haloferax TaxID=2251 RepID=UPI001CD97BE8|nr:MULTISPECIES: S26 family signal peptidase [Haloferax]